ncbi:hypothetical protein DFH06DRAFT_1047328 [Mycena polygramma]|nr:hypothetical protein DFH06DRAFT_1047328 [Mycena polygramma]
MRSLRREARPSGTDEIDAFLTGNAAPGTRYHTLLNSNEAPEGSELLLIQSAVSDVDAQSVRLDEEISKLEKKRASLSIRRAQNKVILSSLRRMPAEVLAEIFLWTLPSITRALDLRRFDVAASPWVLTHISSRWRAVAISTPSLWSWIIINYSSPQSSSPYPMSFVETQIQRAQKLKIHFYCGKEFPLRPQIQMFELLTQHSSRWEELGLGLSANMVPYLAALSDRIPSLKRLWIRCYHGATSLVDSIDCFQSAPALIDVGLYHDDRHFQIPLPMHLLTRYQMTVSGTWEQHGALLKLAPNLVEAHVDIEVEDESWPDPDETIELVHLRRLYVSDSGFLDYINAPILEDLALFVRSHNTSDLEHITPFLERSACTLGGLCLKGSPDPQATSQMLRTLSTITKLAIVIENSDAGRKVNQLVSALTVSKRRGSTTLAPQLCGLFFGCQFESHIDYARCLAMLKSRWHADGCALKTGALVVDMGLKPDPATLCGFRTLQQEGLDLLVQVEDAMADHDETGKWVCTCSCGS